LLVAKAHNLIKIELHTPEADREEVSIQNQMNTDVYQPESSTKVEPEVHKLLDVLAQTPEIIARRIASLSDAELRRRGTEDHFSPVEDVCHLRDLEIEGYAVRINRILDDEHPFLPDFDGGRIAFERDYNSQDIRQALGHFAEARRQNLERLRDLAPAQLTREGTLEGVGRITLAKLLLLMSEHDEGHLQTFASP
jgi:hypothetical protein